MSENTLSYLYNRLHKEDIWAENLEFLLINLLYQSGASFLLHVSLTILLLPLTFNVFHVSSVPSLSSFHSYLSLTSYVFCLSSATLHHFPH